MDSSKGILSPSQIKELMQSLGLTPTKNRGQNFLINQHIVEQMITALSPNAHDVCVEVGGGLGVLSLPLAELVKQLVIVELDPQSQRILETRLAEADIGSDVNIVSGDVLQISSAALPGQFKLISSIPYSITSPLLHRFIIEWGSRWDNAVFMMQKEVMEKIITPPPKGSYWYHFVEGGYETTVINGTVSGQSFWPQPRVDSSIIAFQKKADISLDMQAWSDFLHIVFTHPRKQIHKSLDREMVMTCGVDPQKRPGALTTVEMTTLFTAFNEKNIQRQQR